MKPSKLKAILLTTLLVGTMDAVAALIKYYLSGGSNAANVFKFIASGVFGFSAFAGGSEMVVYGILFHFLITLFWVALFFMAYPLIRLHLNQYLVGLIYGILIWAVMNLAIVPLSNAPALAQDLIENVIGTVIIVLLVGVPITVSYRQNT